MQKKSRQKNAIHIRFRSDEDRERVKKAADARRWSLNTFVAETALAEANKFLKQRQA